MKTYNITIRTSGVNMGNFDGETPEAAHLAMIKDAGYASIEEAADVIGESVDDLTADAIITEIA